MLASPSAAGTSVVKPGPAASLQKANSTHSKSTQGSPDVTNQSMEIDEARNSDSGNCGVMTLRSQEENFEF